MVGCFRSDRCFIFCFMLEQPQKVGFMSSRHKHILVFFSILGVLLVPVGDIMTVQGRFAKGDDFSIYLVDFDEFYYDLYIDGYYPSDYTYDDFRRDSIESMVSHYVATDNNNFSSVVDTIENDVLQNGWSVIKDFFVDSWIDLKSGVITVAQGFTDDFKHELDGRFKTSPSSDTITIGSGQWIKGRCIVYRNASFAYDFNSVDWGVSSIDDVYWTVCSNGGVLACAVSSGSVRLRFTYNYVSGGQNTEYMDMGSFYSGSLYSGYYLGTSSLNTYYISGLSAQYSDKASACAEFYGNSPIVSDPVWNGVGYYSDTPTDFSINLPALPAIDWQSISNNNKNTYGVEFPDVDLTVDFQLPDSYYPHTVIYDVPYWLYNTDSTPVDWANVSFDDVTLPEVQLSDGDGSFFQALFNTLPLAFVPILLGVILCYLIFLML